MITSFFSLGLYFVANGCCRSLPRLPCLDVCATEDSCTYDVVYVCFVPGLLKSMSHLLNFPHTYSLCALTIRIYLNSLYPTSIRPRATSSGDIYFDFCQNTIRLCQQGLEPLSCFSDNY